MKKWNKSYSPRKMMAATLAMTLALGGLATTASADEVENIEPTELVENENPEPTELVDVLDEVAEVEAPSDGVVDTGPATVTIDGEKLIVVPDNPAEAITVDSLDGDTLIEIDQPRLEVSDAQVVGGGSSAYAGDDVSVVVQPTDGGGVQALVIIESANAPREYPFGITPPAGGTLQLDSDGGVMVLDADGALSSLFEAPWATDATGQAVPTHYRLEGNTLIQVVEFDRDTAFPVVADPNWLQLGKCVAEIAVFVASNAVFATKIAKLGGAAKAAKKIYTAAKVIKRYGWAWNSYKARDYIATIIGGIAADFLGITRVLSTCSKV